MDRFVSLSRRWRIVAVVCLICLAILSAGVLVADRHLKLRGLYHEALTNTKRVAAQSIRKTLSINSVRLSYEIATRIRDYVHRKSVGNRAQYGDRLSNYVDGYLLLERGELFWICGNLAATYQFMLSALGWPSRTIQLASKKYLDGENRFATHVTVEVWTEDMGWVVSDPTFNASFGCNGDGRRLSIEQLYQCVGAGKKIEPILDSGPVDPLRSLANYYETFDNLLYAVAGVAVKSENASISEFVAPLGWMKPTGP